MRLASSIRKQLGNQYAGEPGKQGVGTMTATTNAFSVLLGLLSPTLRRWETPGDEGAVYGAPLGGIVT